MPLFRITVKTRVNTNRVRLEPGMYVDVVSNSYSDPVHTNGGQCGSRMEYPQPSEFHLLG